MASLKIIPLGGMGNVTRNMFVYEYGDELLLVDCGIGFPESSMLGVDVLIPDVSYILGRIAQGAHIVGMCLSHAHDDHIAALPYIVPQLPDFEIYGSELTAAFAMSRMAEFELKKEVNVIDFKKQLTLGSFTVDYIHVTHSVPQTTHLAIGTPEGVIYHGSDFKFDLTPVDGRLPDFEKMTEVSKRGILCLLSDCLRVDRKDWAASESTLLPSFEREIVGCKGKFIVTLMSSNLHRIQLLSEVALAHGRKMVFIGRSVEQNVEIARELKVLSIPNSMIVHKKHMDEYDDAQLCVVVAGSQGQPGSSLVRAISGEHPLLSVNPNDKVVFATEPIPGNESNVYEAIDALSHNKIEVSYSDKDEGLHVSGHAGAIEQQLLIAMTKPAYLFPIGGAERHRTMYAEMVRDLGYPAKRVLLPSTGDIIEFSHGTPSIHETIQLKDMMVDGRGVGDVGALVLSDRKTMSQEGMVVVVIPKDGNGYDMEHVQVVSRGFVFMKQADDIVKTIKDEVAQTVEQGGEETEMRHRIEKRLTRSMDDLIGRTPLIITVFMQI